MSLHFLFLCHLTVMFKVVIIMNKSLLYDVPCARILPPAALAGRPGAALHFRRQIMSKVAAPPSVSSDFLVDSILLEGGSKRDKLYKPQQRQDPSKRCSF